MNLGDGRQNDRAGFTLTELLVFLPIMVFVGIWASNLLRKPVFLARSMENSKTNNLIVRAGNSMSQEIAGAAPGSINWSLILPAVSTNTNIFGFALPSYVNNVPQLNISVTYYFQLNPGAATGSLIRASGGTETVLATNLDPPTPAFPLVQQDTANLNMLILTLLHTPRGATQTRLVRRVALRT